jgi:hypothetical protein
LSQSLQVPQSAVIGTQRNLCYGKRTFLWQIQIWRGSKLRKFICDFLCIPSYKLRLTKLSIHVWNPWFCTNGFSRTTDRLIFCEGDHEGWFQKNGC